MFEALVEAWADILEADYLKRHAADLDDRARIRVQ